MNGGAYAYYSNYCVCAPQRIYIGMRDLEGEETYQWPVIVYNVNEEAIGTASDKSEYLAIWNSDPANMEIGVLSGGPGPFLFLLKKYPDTTNVDWVIGETAEELVIITEEGEDIISEDDEPLITE